MDPSNVTPAGAIPACYWHADRQTRLSCSRCGRPVCVDCVRPGAVGQQCPECAKPAGRNQVITAQQIRQRRATDGAPVTTAILGVTVAIGLLGFLAPQLWLEIREALAHNTAAVDDGEWWRTITAALLHSRVSFFHILFNMWALWVFGPQLERRVGSLPFGLLYLASAAAGGAAFQLSTDLGLAVGASGAIFGLFGAWTAAAWSQRHTAPGRANLNQLLILLGINLALPLFVTGIAWQAHVGGLLAGGLIALLWLQLETSRAARAVVAASVLVFSLALVILL